LLIFLFANTELGQLLELPVLIHHYTKHHHDDAGMSFLNFLHKHYLEEKSHPSANNEHEKLPFKSHDFGFLQSNIMVHPAIVFDLKTNQPVLIKVPIIYAEAFISSTLLSRIWQPPKSC